MPMFFGANAVHANDLEKLSTDLLFDQERDVDNISLR
jgi:hypothetical protein